MESKIGFFLSLIGGILAIVTAFPVMFFPKIADFMLAHNLASGESFPKFAVILFFIFGILILIAGILSIFGGVLMKKPKKVKTGGVISLICGIILFFTTGMPLVLIGGILGLVAADKQS